MFLSFLQERISSYSLPSIVQRFFNYYFFIFNYLEWLHHELVVVGEASASGILGGDALVLFAQLCIHSLP